MAYLVNVTFAPDKSLVSEFKNWVHGLYMPEVCNTPGCAEVRFLRISQPEGQDDAYAVQFVAVNNHVAVNWLEERLSCLLGEFFAIHKPQSMPFFASVMEILDER